MLFSATEASGILILAGTMGILLIFAGAMIYTRKKTERFSREVSRKHSRETETLGTVFYQLRTEGEDRKFRRTK